MPVDGAPKIDSEPVPPAPVPESPKPGDSTQVLDVKAEIAELKAAIAAKKASGEIAGASESTIQQLLEELKAARADLALLRNHQPISSPDDPWAKWFP